MKNGKIIIALCLVSTLSIVFSLAPNPVFATFEYTVMQPGIGTHVVKPIERTQTNTDFYDYWSASGHTPFMEDLVSKIYLYKETTTGELSLIMHHSMDNSVSDYMSEDFDLDWGLAGMPAGVYLALSDDGGVLTPGEFNFARVSNEGRWRHWHNSDGGVIGGLPTDMAWCLEITPYFNIPREQDDFRPILQPIEAWEYTQECDSVEVSTELNMEEPLTICCSLLPPPVPLFSDILAILPLGIVAGAVVIRRRRKVSN